MCTHERFHTISKQFGMTRFIPFGWERESEGECFENVTITDTITVCSDCGEYLECEYGD